jgi:sec-independent protein translocase protein TatC
MDKAPLTSHLGELRNRILISLSIVLIAFMGGFYYSEHIFGILTAPLHYTLKFSLENPFISFVPAEAGIDLVFLAPAEALWMHIKISFISAFIVSSPVIFYETWKFVAPGLLQEEKKYAMPFVLTTTFLFLVGALFCFVIVLPFAMNFLLTYKTQHLKPMLSVGKYVDFCLKFILAFGAIFELPVIMVFLSKMGIVTPEFLSKNRKYAVLIAFVLAALLTPTPDAFNQMLMAIPMIILYEVGIVATKIFMKKKKEEDKEEGGEEGSPPGDTQ